MVEERATWGHCGEPPLGDPRSPWGQVQPGKIGGADSCRRRVHQRFHSDRELAPLSRLGSEFDRRAVTGQEKQ